MRTIRTDGLKKEISGKRILIWVDRVDGCGWIDDADAVECCVRCQNDRNQRIGPNDEIYAEVEISAEGEEGYKKAMEEAATLLDAALGEIYGFSGRGDCTRPRRERSPRPPRRRPRSLRRRSRSSQEKSSRPPRRSRERVEVEPDYNGYLVEVSQSQVESAYVDGTNPLISKVSENEEVALSLNESTLTSADGSFSLEVGESVCAWLEDFSRGNLHPITVYVYGCDGTGSQAIVGLEKTGN